MRRSLFAGLAASGLILTTSCGEQPLTLDDYEKALTAASISRGEKEPQAFQLIGAKNGYGFSVGSDSRCEVYEFDTSIESGKKALEVVQKEGLMGTRLEFNKNLGIFCQGDSPEAKKAVSSLMSMQ